MSRSRDHRVLGVADPVYRTGPLRQNGDHPIPAVLCSGRVQRAQVPAELQEPGPGLARLEVPVQLVLAQFLGGEQVPDPGGGGIGGAQPQPRGASEFLGLAADRGPLPFRARLQVLGPGLIRAERDRGVVDVRGYVAVGDRVQALDPGFLRRVMGSFEAFQVFIR